MMEDKFEMTPEMKKFLDDKMTVAKTFNRMMTGLKFYDGIETPEAMLVIKDIVEAFYRKENNA
jgi:hypothetical protein